MEDDGRERIPRIVNRVTKAFRYATTDPEAAAGHARKAAEEICRDVHEREIGPPGAMTLEPLLQRLAHGDQRKIPERIHIHIAVVQRYGNYAVHGQADPRPLGSDEIGPCMAALLMVARWYTGEFCKQPIPDALAALSVSSTGEVRAPGLEASPAPKRRKRRTVGPAPSAPQAASTLSATSSLAANPSQPGPPATNSTESAVGGSPGKSGRAEVRSVPAPSSGHIRSLLSRLRRLEPTEYALTSKAAGGAPVQFARALFVDPLPVTQDLYEVICKDNPSEFRSPKRPVERVSWIEAVKFCNALSFSLGLEPAYSDELRLSIDASGFRLPTEAEWEYACAGAGVPAGPLEKSAWYMGNAHGRTEDVGQLPANGHGLQDMLGNVWEWCNDWYVPSPRLRGDDPMGPPTGEDKVCRGGSWANPALLVTPAARHKKGPRFRDNNIGFRIVTRTPFGSSSKSRGE